MSNAAPALACLLALGCLLRLSPADRAPKRRLLDQEEPLPDAQVDGIEVVKAWAKRRVALGEQRFAASGLPRRPSPASWAGTVIYQVQVDRFNNGNVSNDYLNMPKAGGLSRQLENAAAGDFGDLPDWRHGGDVQGIRDRLGYLQDLGIQTLWVTPVLMHDGGYHGYCLTDPTTTDPAFGTPEEFRDFVADAHRHGISVVLDVVTNHMCDATGVTRYYGPQNRSACAKELNDAYWEGRPVNNMSQAHLNFSTSFFPPFRTEAFFSRCGLNTVDSLLGLQPDAVFGDFASSMFDLNTLNYDFQELYTNLHKYWVAYADIDGMRLDAVKHVTKDFLAYFSTEMRAYARTIGKKNFLIIGEEGAADEHWKAMSYGMMMSNPQNPEEHGKVPEALTQRLITLEPVYLADPVFPAPGMTSLYNFKASEAARRVMRCQNNATTLEDYFRSDTHQILMDQSVPQKGAEPDAHLWTALDLHDWPRFLNVVPNRTALLKAALAWHLTAPGSPIIYYGTEQGFNGRCGRIATGSASSDSAIRAVCDRAENEDFAVHPDSLKRQDMFVSGPFQLGSTLEEVDRSALISNTVPAVSQPWQDDSMLRRNHSVYKLTKQLVALRRSCPSLSAGTIVWHEAESVDCGLVAYSRHPHDGQSDAAEVVMVVNPGGAGPLQVPSIRLGDSAAWKDGQLYVNAFNLSQVAKVQPSQQGGVELLLQDPDMEVGGFRAFVRKDQVTSFDSDLGIALCKKQTQFV